MNTTYLDSQFARFMNKCDVLLYADANKTDRICLKYACEAVERMNRQDRDPGNREAVNRYAFEAGILLAVLLDSGAADHEYFTSVENMLESMRVYGYDDSE